MSEAAYLTDNAPTYLTGVTGAQGDYSTEGGTYGGKTALSAWWFDLYGEQRDVAIFANFKHDDIMDVVDGAVEVTSVDALADSMSAGKRKLVLSPAHHDWEEVSRRLEAFVRSLPGDMSKFVVLDEAPELDQDAVLSFVRVHGNGAECKTLLLSQSPTDLSTTVVKQTLLVWVGPMKSDYESWFRTHDRGAAYRHIDAEHEPYHWTVVYGKGKGEWDHYQPVPEVYGEV